MKWRLDPSQIEVIDDATVEMLRSKTFAERVEMINDAHRAARRLIADHIRQQHPNWSPESVQAEVSRRLLTSEPFDQMETKLGE